ncbi:hypothetical protein S245_028143, partial [Arachis hypogaea]
MDGDAVPWYQMMQCANPFHSWPSLARALESEFGPSPFDCPRATLFKLSETTTVNAYYSEFTSLVNRVFGLAPDAILDCFISGLQQEIKRDVLAFHPMTLQRVVSLARLFEEKYVPAKSTQQHSG